MNGEMLAESLSREIGIDFQVVGPDLLSRCVGSRMRLLGWAPDRRDEYEKLIQRDPTERLELVECLLVPETWFFRDQRPFDLIRTRARAWISDANRAPLRVLSLPCSTGAEPYSVALTLLDEGLDPSRFRVLAVDLSEKNLRDARRGCYRERAVRLVPRRLRDRYFTPNDDIWRLGAEVAEMVEFRRGNIVDPSLLLSEPPFDLVLCRNVLIYLTVEARKRVVTNLDRCLRPGGTLIVGHADRLRILDERFTSLDDPGHFAYRKEDPSDLPSPSAVPPIGQSAPAGDASRDQPPRGGKLGPAPPRPRLHLSSTPSPSTATQSPTRDPTTLDLARSMADARRYSEAIALCEGFLAHSGPSAPAFFLLGMVHQAMGDDGEAEKLLRKAVYLEADHADALLGLALLARRRGDEVESGRLMRRSEKARSSEVRR